MPEKGTYGAIERKDFPKVVMTEVGKWPVGEVLGEAAIMNEVLKSGAEVMTVSTPFGVRVAAMRARARAAGLAEAEVEKISTCPLVKLLVGQKGE